MRGEDGAVQRRSSTAATAAAVASDGSSLSIVGAIHFQQSLCSALYCLLSLQHTPLVRRYSCHLHTTAIQPASEPHSSHLLVTCAALRSVATLIYSSSDQKFKRLPHNVDWQQFLNALPFFCWLPFCTNSKKKLRVQQQANDTPVRRA